MGLKDELRQAKRQAKRPAVVVKELDERYSQISDLNNDFDAKISAWRERSAPLLYLYSNTQRLRQLYTAVLHKVQTRQSRARGLRSGSSRSLKARVSRGGAAAATGDRRVAPQQHPPAPTQQEVEAQAVARQLGSWGESCSFAAGSLLFGLLLFVAGAAPAALPALFLAFFFIAMPARVVHFCRMKWTFFLVDFCYFANAAAVVYLLFFPGHARLQTLVLALTDGPLAGALLAWQCAWVFGSPDHAVSVLMHLLPGLAMFANRYYPSPAGWRGMLDAGCNLLSGAWFDPAAASQHVPLQQQQQTPSGSELPLQDNKYTWLLAAPLLFYASWQIIYWFVVQVACRSFILRNGYDTSYNCLARRAAKTNNFWNRTIRRGSLPRRCFMYGLTQLVFTVICLAGYAVVHHSFKLGMLWQVIKVVAPVYFGSRYQCEKLPQHSFMKGVRKLSYSAVNGMAGGLQLPEPVPAGADSSSGKQGQTDRRKAT